MVRSLDKQYKTCYNCLGDCSLRLKNLDSNPKPFNQELKELRASLLEYFDRRYRALIDFSKQAYQDYLTNLRKDHITAA